MKRLILILLFFSLSASAQKPDVTYKILEASYVTLNAIDLGTTIYGLNNGAREANPLIRNASPFMIGATKALTTTSVLLINRQLYKHNPKAAKITMLCFNVLSGLVVTNNITVIIKL